MLARWRSWLAAKRWRRIALDVALALVVLGAVTLWQGRNLVGSGEPAPALALRGLDGRTYDLADYRGRKVLVVFWAPWCGVCKASNHNVKAVAGSDDPVVLSVALSYDGVASVEEYVREQEVSWPVLLGDDDVGDSWAVGAYPTTYVIDEEGRIEHAVVGYVTELGLRLRLL